MAHRIPKTLRALSRRQLAAVPDPGCVGLRLWDNEDLAVALRMASVHDVTLLKGVEDMPGLMAQADLADQRRGQHHVRAGSWAS
ncbi:MAG: hypothetical protein R2856_33635 [Caldilineaceae bacterium]